MSRNSPITLDDCFSAFNEHRRTCRVCGPWSSCKVGLGLLREGADLAAKKLGKILEPRAKA